MKSSSVPLWTIDQLGAQVALALSVDYPGAPNDRVRDVPDRRTIRYYTTLGLIDRPTELRGRTAYYSQRHLLQLVAIKRLQAQGLSLTEVQQRLLGLPDAALRSLARLPPEVAEPDAPPLATPPPEERSDGFWRAVPAPLPAEGEPRDRPPEPETEATRLLQGIRLDEAVLLLLPASRPVDDDDLEAIRTAAAPLLKLLEGRRLLRPRQERREP